MSTPQIAVVRLGVHSAAPMFFEVTQQGAVMCVHLQSSEVEYLSVQERWLQVDHRKIHLCLLLPRSSPPAVVQAYGAEAYDGRKREFLMWQPHLHPSAASVAK